MKYVRIILWVLAPFLLSSCTSCIKRAECEKVNWYDYGHKLAMQGKRPGMDTLVQDCRKVEANIRESDLDRGFKEGMNNYCRPETVYQTGKAGTGFNTEFCDPGHLPALRQQHKKGINEYCLPDSGYRIGAEGKTYTGVCSADQEKAFMPQYRKGRKKYLELMIVETEKSIADSDREQQRIDRESSIVAMRLASLPAPRVVIERRWDPTSNSYREESKTNDPYSFERDRLSREVDQYQSQQNALASKRKKLSDDLTEYRKELVQVSE